MCKRFTERIKALQIASMQLRMLHTVNPDGVTGEVSADVSVSPHNKLYKVTLQLELGNLKLITQAATPPTAV